ncbi:MAG: GNAT family N-acetyltransferase [Chloroflexia bacterium]
MEVKPVTLEGRAVRLEPLSLEHAPALHKAAAPNRLFAYSGRKPADDTLEAFEAYMQGLLDDPDWCPFVTILRETGEPIGVTCYLDLRPQHRGLEIGGTWIAEPYQGTVVNPEAKYLMLRHAFETLGAVRVQIKTDGRNLRSQRAISKLGAVHEGVLRKHMVTSDGYIRDTVMYSITDDEWPVVKAGLEARLGYVP